MSKRAAVEKPLTFEKDKEDQSKLLYVIIMSRMHFRVNPHTIFV